MEAPSIINVLLWVFNPVKPVNVAPALSRKALVEVSVPVPVRVPPANVTANMLGLLPSGKEQLLFTVRIFAVCTN